MTLELIWAKGEARPNLPRAATIVLFILLPPICLLSSDYTPSSITSDDQKSDRIHKLGSLLEGKQQQLIAMGWHLETLVDTINPLPISSVILKGNEKQQVKRIIATKCHYSWAISASFAPIKIAPGRRQTVRYNLGNISDVREIEYRLASGDSHIISVFPNGVTKGDAAAISRIVSTDDKTVKCAFLGEEIITVIGIDEKIIQTWYTGMAKIIVFAKPVPLQEKKEK